jgi:hypothetical protein
MSVGTSRGRRLAFSLTVLACGTFAACRVTVDSTAVKVREEHEFRVSGTPDLDLATFDGSIDVRAWDRPEIRVEVERAGGTREAAESVTVVTQQDGDRIRVEAHEPGRSRWVVNSVANLSRSARLVASVPRSCNLSVRSGDGALRVERVTGEIKLTTSDGDVRGFDLDGDVAVDTGDGSVKLEHVAGVIDVRTGEGPVWLGGQLGVVRIRATEGTVALKLAEGSRMDGDWDVSTGDGGVVLYLPDTFGAELDAMTSEGAVRVEDGLAIAHAHRSKRTLKGPLGEGGRILRIRTGDGSITLRKH